MADIRVTATGLRFPEGPVAMADGSVILGEIAGGAVTRVMPDGTKTVVSAAGGGPNGLALGPDGALFLCNNGGNEYAEGGFLSTGPSKDYRGGYIQRIDPRSGDTRVLYSHCGQHKLSAPNDIVFDRRGGSISPISANGERATATMAGSTTPCPTDRKSSSSSTRC
jgi:gluconolactonase